MKWPSLKGGGFVYPHHIVVILYNEFDIGYYIFYDKDKSSKKEYSNENFEISCGVVRALFV